MSLKSRNIKIPLSNESSVRNSVETYKDIFGSIILNQNNVTVERFPSSLSSQANLHIQQNQIQIEIENQIKQCQEQIEYFELCAEAIDANIFKMETHLVKLLKYVKKNYKK
ncbi:Hypothetical_protein [Hexamita inflata]|uniref:Hypothetical_protein n=1 Tax=Hexamita inflata TaxID=28002 RepID=A0AA86UIQ3_9EUKA|nr:Hypothetical protein HINF_LOCUS47520 [Hexamita inflata]